MTKPIVSMERFPEQNRVVVRDDTGREVVMDEAAWQDVVVQTMKTNTYECQARRLVQFLAINAVLDGHFVIRTEPAQDPLFPDKPDQEEE